MSTSQTLRFAPQFLVAVSVLALAPTFVQAEGSKQFNGAFGVNRVVRTKSAGYVEVEGTFNVTASLPDPDTNRVAKEHGNRPNPYLGGNVAGIEYDGGLMWIPETSRVHGQFYYPGWSAFIYGKSVTTSPEVLVGNKSYAWRHSTNQTSTFAAITSKLRMTFRDDGKVSLFVGAMPHGGTFFHAGKRVYARPATPTHPAIPIAPTQSDGRVFFRRNRLRTADVKRVSALTRTGDPKIPLLLQQLLPSTKGYHDELDGSVVRILWSGGQVRKRGGKIQPWVSADVNQSATGYDGARDGAPNHRDWDMVINELYGRPQLSRDTLGNILSIKTVAFPDLDQKSVGRQSSVASENATQLFGTLSRYSQETVRINLRVSSAPWGIEVLNGNGF